MPIYEYQCQSCDKQMEVLRKINDAPLVKCPSCGEDSLRKKISAAAFRLKGSGWYETDFKTSGQKNLASGSDEKAPSAPTAKTADTAGSSSSSDSSSPSSSGSGSGSSESKSTA